MQETNEILSSAFSLAKSGGIYFEGARVESTESELILFVGLGGTGCEALIYTKNQIHNRMKLPTDPGTKLPIVDVPKNMAFLAMDTDAADVENKHCGNTSFASDGSEIMEIGAEEQTNYQQLIDDLQEAKAHGAEYARWLADGTKAIGGKAGAGGRRTVGRVGFFHRYTDIKEMVQKKLTELGETNPGISSYKIILFSGIAGGTGSGTCLDMGYLLKMLGSTFDPQCQVMAYLFMPDVNLSGGYGNPPNLKGNGYAVLKELDYLTEYGKKEGRPFIQAYTGTESISGNIPYDFCHLVTLKDDHGGVYNKDTVMKAVSESVFTYIAREAGLGANAVTTFASLYDNVDNYLLTNEMNSRIPANYSYLSVGASSLMIPYMEINTLIACRMFADLDATVFRNRVTDTSFEEDKSRLGLGTGKGNDAFQDALSGILEKKRPLPAPLDHKHYIPDDVWGEVNRAYTAAESDVQKYQTRMDECAGTAPDMLEGMLQKFLAEELVSEKRGPIYLMHMLKGYDNQNFVGLLRHQAGYFRDIFNQLCAARSGIVERLDLAYAEGAEKQLARGGALKKYLEILREWRKNELAINKYSYMAELAEELAVRYQSYYDHIFEPLRDILTALVQIFARNMEELQVREDEARENPDPGILIYPLQFAEQYKSDFDACVRKARATFLGNLLDNLRYWIQYDIAHVNEKQVQRQDVSGFLSKFISDCFGDFYQTIDMELILENQTANADNVVGHTMDLIEELYKTSHPLFHKNASVLKTTCEFSILSIPSDCPKIRSAANAFIRAKNLKGISVKESAEKNRISLVKVTVGYPLFALQDLNDWESAYESLISTRNTERYMHIVDGWTTQLRNPNVELAWDSHVFPATKKKNAEMRDKFRRCLHAGLIVHQTGEKHALLRLGADIPLEAVVLRGDLREKSNQLEDLKNRVWSPTQPVTRLLDGQGLYAISTSDDGYLRNICENVIRDPEIWKLLDAQCSKLDILEQLRAELENPRYYVIAWLCDMFERTPDTKDILLKRSRNDPMPVTLLEGSIQMTSPEDDMFYYNVYAAFCTHVSQKADDSHTWADVAEENLKIRMHQHADPNELAYSQKLLKRLGSAFKQLAAAFRTQEKQTPAHEKTKKQRLSRIADFYEAAFQVSATYFKQFK